MIASDKLDRKVFLLLLAVLCSAVWLSVWGYRKLTAEEDGGHELFPLRPGITRVYEYTAVADDLDFEGTLEQSIGAFVEIDGERWAPIEHVLTLPDEFAYLGPLISPEGTYIRADDDGVYLKSPGFEQRVLPVPIKHRSRWVVGPAEERLVYRYIDRKDLRFGGKLYKDCVRLRIHSANKHRPRGLMVLAPGVGRVYYQLETAHGTVELTLVEFREAGGGSAITARAP